MPGTTRVEIRTLKVGRYVAIDEDAYKILSISKSKPGKHGSAKARLELEDIFTGQKRSHVGTVTDNIQVPVIEKGSAVITFVQGNEVNAMDNKTYETLILPLDPEMNLEAGGEIQWMEAMGRVQDHPGPLTNEGLRLLTAWGRHGVRQGTKESVGYSGASVAGGEQWRSTVGIYARCPTDLTGVLEAMGYVTSTGAGALCPEELVHRSWL